MSVKKILDYFNIEGTPGGNQDWLTEWDMNMGGCAAVTACDVCIFLSRYEKFRELFPFKIDPNNLSRTDFVKFSAVMKPFLYPRYHGIDLLETYICGFYEYLDKIKNNSLTFRGLSGNVDYETFSEAIINQLDRNIPVPFLLLNHRDIKFDDFEWHWFNLAGYEKLENDINILTVTYGEYQWFSLRNLHGTGYDRKGGIIQIFKC
ncbi:MAG: hypothetical protein IJQ99_05895 [Synergistaceae bacterium]|nr:hypothetical protein [Synergistaceae bacterium]MBR0233377.1 hypothetical protein [Synergistaceae bacterium]MBR0316379.1 hypothetical protein [Synergistaceae bacterium]